MSDTPKFSRIGPYFILSGGGNASEEEQTRTLAEGIREMMREIAHHSGIPLTPDIEITIMLDAERKAKETTQRAKSHGISPGLRALLQAEKKREAEKIAHRLVISKKDLVALKLNCSELGLRHRFFAKEFIPHDIGPLEAPKKLTVEPGSSQMSVEGKKWVGRVSRVFEQRKQLHVHLFENEQQWHFIFFDFADTGARHGNIGPHIHYTSHLWGGNKENTFQNFEIKGLRPKHIHIKFDDSRPKTGEA